MLACVVSGRSLAGGRGQERLGFPEQHRPLLARAGTAHPACAGLRDQVL